VRDQLAELPVRQLGLADGAGEVDVGEHTLQARVLLLQRRQGLVQPVADVMVQLIAQVPPAGALGDKEGVAVVALRIRPLLGLLLAASAGELLADDLGAPRRRPSSASGIASRRCTP
jgi:hypothetical protein